MKLGTKIAMGFVLTSVIFIILVVAVSIFMNPVRQGAEDLSDSVLPMLEQVSNVQYYVTLQGSEARNFLLNPNNDPAIWKRVEDYDNEIESALANLDQNLNAPGSEIINTPEIRSIAQTLRSGYSKYWEMAQSVPGRQNSLRDDRLNIVSVSTQTTAELDELMQVQLSLQLQELIDGASEATFKRRSDRIEILRHVEALNYQVLIGTLRGVVNADPAFFEEAQKMAGQAIELTQQLHSSAINESTKRQAQETVEKLNAVNSVLTTMINNNNASNAAAVTRGGISNQVGHDAAKLWAVAQEMAFEVADNSSSASGLVIMILMIGTAVAIVISLAMAFIITRAITVPVNRLIGDLSEGANAVDNASGQLSQASNTLAEGATENAASLEETSAALEELSSITRRNADNAVEANSLMAQVTEAVGKANNSMGSVITAMEEISVSGNEIGKIIKTIDEIAFQTNLLALNAAVEAARAGEAGAGFAVVADEVRNLAIRSAEAAKSTSELIAATIGNINSGSEMVSATESNFQTVQSHSHKVAELISEVAEASKEQSQGIGQITTAMTEMDKVTQSNAASAEQSASAASQLSIQATNLLNAVDDMRGLVHGGGSAAGVRPSSPRLQVSSKTNASRSLSHKTHDDDFDF